MTRQTRLKKLDSMKVVRVYENETPQHVNCNHGCKVPLTAYSSAKWPDMIHVGVCNHFIYWWMPSERDKIPEDELIRFYASFTPITPKRPVRRRY